MEKIASFRLRKEDSVFLERFSKERKESRGEALRELIEKGRLMTAMRMYKEDKISIGRAAEIAGVSISDFIDMMSEFGINSNLTLEDYKESLENVKKI